MIACAAATPLISIKREPAGLTHSARGGVNELPTPIDGACPWHRSTVRRDVLPSCRSLPIHVHRSLRWACRRRVLRRFLHHPAILHGPTSRRSSHLPCPFGRSPN